MRRHNPKVLPEEKVTLQGGVDAWNRSVSVWTVARDEEKLRLGKGAAFVKSRFKRLRQEDETWEADFRRCPSRSRSPRRTTWAWSSPSRTASSWPRATSRAGPASTISLRCWPTPCAAR